MRDYLDNFDTRVTTKSAEVTASLDQQFVRFQDALEGRTQTLNEALGARVMEMAKALAESGTEVVAALDKRISDVTGVINVRGAKLAENARRQDRRHRPRDGRPRDGSRRQPRYPDRAVRRTAARPRRGSDQGNRSPQPGRRRAADLPHGTAVADHPHAQRRRGALDRAIDLDSRSRRSTAVSSRWRTPSSRIPTTPNARSAT